MIGIVLEQFRKIENSSRTLEHVFAGATILMQMQSKRMGGKSILRRNKTQDKQMLMTSVI